MPILPYAGAGVRVQQNAAAAAMRRRIRLAVFFFLALSLSFMLFSRPKDVASLADSAYAIYDSNSKSPRNALAASRLSAPAASAAAPPPPPPTAMEASPSLSDSKHLSDKQTVNETNALSSPSVKQSPLLSEEDSLKTEEERVVSQVEHAALEHTPAPAPSESNHPIVVPQDPSTGSQTPHTHPGDEGITDVSQEQSPSPSGLQVASRLSTNDFAVHEDATRQSSDHVVHDTSAPDLKEVEHESAQNETATTSTLREISSADGQQQIESKDQSLALLRDVEDRKPAAAMAIEESVKHEENH